MMCFTGSRKTAGRTPLKGKVCERGVENCIWTRQALAWTWTSSLWGWIILVWFSFTNLVSLVVKLRYTTENHSYSQTVQYCVKDNRDEKHNPLQSTCRDTKTNHNFSSTLAISCVCLLLLDILPWAVLFMDLFIFLYHMNIAVKQ